MSTPPAAPARAPDRNEQLNALRRQLIMDAAQRVFERDGLEKTTIRAIASEAGCTTGAVYPWFAGKEAIYGALLDESLQRLHAHLIDTAARSLPVSAARDAIRAFGYYADRPTDFAGPVPVPRPGRAGWGAKWTSSSTAGCGQHRPARTGAGPHQAPGTRRRSRPSR